MTPQTLYYGDCLDWMREWPDNSVDLIYLDPPFNSNANYNIIFGEGNGVPAQVRAFQDTWTWDAPAVTRTQRILNAVAHPAHAAVTGAERFLGGSGMLAYITYMADRLPEMRRLMRPTATIYLHCDPTASHYLKILMDGVFGTRAFRNEIIWCYRGGGVPVNDFARKHDVILRYSGGGEFTFHRQYVPYSEASTALVERRGGVSVDNLPRDLERGATMPDWWTDINSLQTWSPERIGYPTQKPLALLDRIIRSSSNEDDLVLDPFCGGGTTVVAAANLNRQLDRCGHLTSRNRHHAE